MRDRRKFYSLWRCPNCLRAKREAFSLHSEHSERIVCPTCHSEVAAEVKTKTRKYIGPRIRKVAIIERKDSERANAFRALLLGPLNQQCLQGLKPVITDLLSTLQQEGVLSYRLTADPQFL